jgi:hypothetical protein
MDVMRQGWSMRRFQWWQQCSTMSSWSRNTRLARGMGLMFGLAFDYHHSRG